MVADVDPREVAKRCRSHGHPEIEQGLLDLGWIYPFRDHKGGLSHQGRKLTGYVEARAIIDHDRDLSDLSGEGHAC